MSTMKSTSGSIAARGYPQAPMTASDQHEAGPLPSVAAGAAFVPAEDLDGAPHVVVDGARLPGTVLSLSHWPDAGTPAGAGSRHERRDR